MKFRNEYRAALLIFLAALASAAMILTIPALSDPENDTSAWITVALGCSFLGLVALAMRERRKHSPEHE